ncbi:hypothetical protein RT723_10900 [Psychrosphaera aquimarina]|uniref:ApeA N-terminal domain-containing protein n=1 Tax=Psychrosphaera aquimarina TaxID=2044854 RepID=A0ABU3R1C7_9GAMM|nr:hypothetical protein [Psychrosphaera aquimarina]MDU0113496.1 hypothetical protein [Psychrosphaera aquimarina]
MSISVEEIKTLCDNWCEAALQPGGGFVMGHETEKNRLLANGLQFHEVGFEELVAAINGLSKVLLLPGMNTVINQDHYGLWSWCGEVIFSYHSEYFSLEEREIRSLFETCIRASLCGCRNPSLNHEEWERQNNIAQQIPHNTQYFIQNSSLSLAYLAFPLLEAVVKRVCHQYIGLDGKVKAEFTIVGKNGRDRNYGIQGKVSKQCSSLRDLLFLLYNYVADDELIWLLDEFRSSIQRLDEDTDPFDLIYKWRNQSLHGTTNFQTIGGTLLNLSLLICIFDLKEGYTELRDVILQQCIRDSEFGHRSPNSFYPPY